MHHFLFLLPLLPFLGFVFLAALAGRIDKPFVALIGVGSVGLSALLSVGIALSFFLRFPLAGGSFTQHVAGWLSIGTFNADIAFHLDSLSLLMALVVCCVGFLIHVYSIEYMIDERDYARFFACMNLFVAAMLVLVLADNFLLFFLGWEGVGFCSWLLIGFWHQDPANVRSANKAFIVTRLGDVALALGIFVIYNQLGTLHIQTALEAAPRFWLHGGEAALFAASLILIGSLGKSGQLPLQVWLPDAMAGPTPVSALIHAATMVTAGVYLLARMSALFMLAPVAMHATAVIGAATLLVAGLCALAQNDIKRALAYSTVSQLGYMYLALGVGAYSAAMFHFMTHAFFKALLFMAAGWIIVALHHEQDMRHMGGLRRHMPTAFWCFLVGSLSLAAFPFIDSGFYSKELILGDVFASGWYGQELWLVGCIGAFITALYTGRMMMLVFFGKSQAHLHIQPGHYMRLPLIVLAILATVGGAPEFLKVKEGETILHTWFTGQFHTQGFSEHLADTRIQAIAIAAVLLGLFSAWVLFGPMRKVVSIIFSVPPGRWVHNFWAAGAGFDTIYSLLFVMPYTLFAKLNRNDLFSALDKSITGVAISSNRMLVSTQNGNVRWYMAAIALGAVATIIVAVFI